MKRFFFVLVLVSSFAAASRAQLNVWRQQNPQAGGVTFRAVQMITSDTIYVCGDNATFGRSTDGGFSWQLQSPAAGLTLQEPYSLNFYGLNFLNSKYGMVCGDSGRILKTTDGGATWTVSIAVRNSASYFAIVLIDTSIAVTVGKGGILVRTTDGGTTWNAVANEKTSDFTSLRKLRPDFLSIAGLNGALLTSADSGKNWTPIPITINGSLNTANIFGHVFTSPRSAIVVGEIAFIAQTLDSGNSWQSEKISDTAFLTAPLNYIDGKDPNVLAIIGNYGTILYSTTNGGLQWNKYPLMLQDSLIGLSFLDKYTAIAVGQDGVVMKTTDGGVTWKFLPYRPFTCDLLGIAFNKGDTSLGIAVGFAGILRTSNGGANWTQPKLDSILTLRTVAFANANTILAAGDHGVIVKSIDAGLTWNIVPNAIFKNIRSIVFPTPNFGWVCGDSGTLFSTIDAGASWIKHPFNKKRTLTGISFADSLHGYISSDKGIYTTTDGGVTWEDPSDDTYFVPCVGISSPSSNVVCAVGTGCGGSPGAAILVSQDGGKTWSDNSFTFGYMGTGILTGVQFSDDLHGTIVGANHNGNKEGYILHTTDGGKTWHEQISNAFWSLTAVSFGTRKAGTAVGYRGTIIRRTTNE